MLGRPPEPHVDPDLRHEFLGEAVESGLRHNAQVRSAAGYGADVIIAEMRQKLGCIVLTDRQQQSGGLLCSGQFSMRMRHRYVRLSHTPIRLLLEASS